MFEIREDEKVRVFWIEGTNEIEITTDFTSREEAEGAIKLWEYVHNNKHCVPDNVSIRIPAFSKLQGRDMNWYPKHVG